MSDPVTSHFDRVRRRVEAAIPYSPEWQAAMAELEELEAELNEAAPPERPHDPPLVPTADPPALL